MTDIDSTSQPTQRVTGCMVCSAPVIYVTTKKVLCESCRKERLRESARLAAEKKRRAAGVAKVKNAPHECLSCGQTFVRYSVFTKRCPPCQKEHALNEARELSRERCRARGAAKIGSSCSCKHCGSAFVKTSGNRIYCSACRKLQAQNKLPHLKEWQANYRKEWTEKNYKGERREDYQALCRASRARRKARHGHAFSINERMSAGIRQSLRLGKGGWRWEALTGYTVQELADHLERQFTKGMTWDRFMSGEIHIDHIIPKTSFRFDSYEDQEFKQCWALSNLRPMWAIDNVRKGDSRLYLL